MIFQTPYTPKKYTGLMYGKLTHFTDLINSKTGFIDFGRERFTGFVWGRAFCITHHCAYEWNRKITGQKNTAIGIVKKNGDGSLVYFLTLPGAFRPQIFLPSFVLITLGLLLFSSSNSASMTLLELLISSMICTLVVALISALGVWFTEDGHTGHGTLLALVEDPNWPEEASK